MGRGISTETKNLVARANKLWETVYEPAGIVPTLRQLFYALAVEEYVPKSDAGYGRVQRALVWAREHGEYPWEGMSDGLRELRTINTWDDLPDYFETIRRAYRLDKWRLQPIRVEIWVEKHALIGTIQIVADEFEVPLLSGHGYLSVTAKNEASQRIAGRPLLVLYVGDHDPSGVQMQEEAETWIGKQSGAEVRISRVAVTDDDHANPALPHLPVNKKDTRAEDYVRRYGEEVVEAEAIPPVDLQNRVRRAIEVNLDEPAWQKALRREARDRRELIRRLGAG